MMHPLLDPSREHICHHVQYLPWKTWRSVHLVCVTVSESELSCAHSGGTEEKVDCNGTLPLFDTIPRMLCILYKSHSNPICRSACSLQDGGITPSVIHVMSHPYRGEMSQPCCMKAPRENQRELKMPNSFGGWSVGPCSAVPSSGSSACHSYGLKRLTWGSGWDKKSVGACRAQVHMFCS